MPATVLWFVLALVPGALRAAGPIASAEQWIEAQETAGVEDLVRRGRELLDQEKPAEAEALFIEAEVRSGKSIAIRKWVWRAWMQGGRINDALDAVDAIEPRGELPQADLDYLRGMAFFFRGRTYVDQEVGEPFTSAAFRDAMEWLGTALRADPEQYRDAFLPLAECAWHSHEYTIGRHAAEEAIRVAPTDPHGGLLLGRILFQRYLDLAADPKQHEAADGVWSEIVPVLERTLATIGAIETSSERELAADAWLQIGYAHEQKQHVTESTRAFAEALGLWPEGADLQDLRSRFAAPDFRRMVEEAAVRASTIFASDAGDDAVLWWWIGSARFADEAWKEAALAFERAVAKRATYSDGWYWAARALGRTEETARAVADLRAGWQADAAMLARKLQEGGANDRAWIGELTEWSTRENRTADRELLDAIRAAAWPDGGGEDPR